MKSARLVIPGMMAALALGAATAESHAHDLPGSTNFSIFLPQDEFTGRILFITYIGPDAGQNVWHAKADLTWISTGGTPASQLLINFELAINGSAQHWTVTGADLGWGSGPGTFTGVIDTDRLNGLLTPNGPFGGSLIHVEIGTTTGDGVFGGHFENSSFTLELAPIPAPGGLALLALITCIKTRRRRD